MINFIKYFSLLSITFLVSFELLSTFSVNSNVITVTENKASGSLATNDQTVFLIGDSYAKTDYVEEGFPVLFQKHFDSIGLNFVDLSKSGSELNVHKKLLDSLSALNPKLIIYYYNMGDVISLEQSEPELTESNKEKDITQEKSSPSFSQNLSNLAIKSKSMGLIKDAIQYSYLAFTDKPSPGSFSYNFPLWNKKHEKEIQELFNSIKSENVIIFITTPFNCGKKPKTWEQYDLFNNMELNNNVMLIQSVDVLNDPNFSVSWRNGHPNQEGVRMVTDSIIKFYSNK